MRLNLTMMITSVSDQKKNSYLTGVNFPHTFLIDISNVAKLYVSIHSIALLRSTAGKKLKENYKKWTEAFSSEYNFNSIQEKYPYLEFKYLYLCTFNNEELPKMIDTFLINGINARIVLALTPYNDKWAYDFGIASNQEIDHLLKIHFDKVLELKGKKLKKILEGRLLNPHYLEEFTIPILPGMDKIKDIPLIIPSKFMLTTSENAINLGKVIDLRTGKELIDATIPIQQINRHLGIFATTGAGKTNLCYHILNQIYPDIPVLIFDWKREYRSLHKMIDAKIYDFIGNNLFYFNPLIPSGEPSQWIKQAANIMAETVGGGVYAGGAFSVYIDVLDSLYRDHGIYDGSTNYPTIFDLLQGLEDFTQRRRLSERQKNWVASATKIFVSLNVGKTKEAFSASKGYGIEDIINNNVVIEVDGLGDPKAIAFFISILLQMIRNYRMNRHERNELKHIIVIEEAQNCLAFNLEPSSTITSTFREIRGLCEGIIYVTQEPSRISKDAIANTNTFLIMKLIEYLDQQTACNLIGLPTRDIHTFQGLDVGVCWLKADDAVIIKTPYIPQPIVEVSDFKLPTLIELTQPAKINETTPTIKTRQEVSASFAQRTDVQKRSKDLKQQDWLVLKYIGESKAYNNTTLKESMNYSNKEINNITNTLIKKGFVGYRYGNKRGPGRKQKIYFLFPYGEEAYRQEYDQYPDKTRTTLIEEHSNHTEMKGKVIETLALPTRKDPENRFDIIFKSEDKEFPVEIETGTNNNKQIYTNIQKSIVTYEEAYFIAVEHRIYYAILQLAAKYNFDKGQEFDLHIAIYNDFISNKEWDVFHFDDFSYAKQRMHDDS